MIKWFRKKDWRLVAVVTHGTRLLYGMEGYDFFPSNANFHFYENQFGGRKVKVAAGNTGAFRPKQSKFWMWCKDWSKGKVHGNRFPTHKEIVSGYEPIHIDTRTGGV